MNTAGRKSGWLLVACLAAVSSHALCDTAAWSYRADFQHGFSGWMSFPLAQDIGFDPTLAVENAELIREVTSAGQKRLRLGMFRPMHFVARAETRLRIRYRAELTAASVRMRAILSSEDGRRYESDIPSGTGSHEISLSGTQLGIQAEVAMRSVVIECLLDRPSMATPNRIVLQQFELASFRPREVPVLAPELLADDDVQVAARPLLEGEPFVVKLGIGSAATIRLTNPRGEEVTGSLSGSAGVPGLWTADITTHDAHTRFLYVVMAKPAAHPRTLLTAERLQRLRTGNEYAALRKQIQTQAHAPAAQIKTNVSAGANVQRLPSGRSLRAEYDGELTAYFQLLDSYANSIATCALDYALNGDRTSLDTAKRNLLAVAQWPTWTPPRFAKHGMHTYYEAGLFAQKLAFGYDLIAAELTQSDKEQIAGAFRTNVIEPTVDEYFRYDRMPLAASNWMANSVGGALMAAAVTQGDVQGWREHEGVALSQLAVAYVRNLKALFPGDGSEMEPIGYQHFAMEGFSWGAAALESLQIRPRQLQRMYDAFWWPRYAMVGPSLLLGGGDFDGELRSFDGFAYAAEHSGIPGLTAFYAERPKRDPSLLDLVCCTGDAQLAGDPPLTRIFGDRGSAVLRSGWDERATVVSLRAGPWFNHEHHDQGSFQVSAFGERIISEAGYANYYRDPNYPTYFTQAPGHNTVLIDDDPFSQTGGAAIASHLLSPQLDYVETDLSRAYDGQLSAYRREFVFLRPDVLIVSDELRAPEPHTFTWLLHPADGKMPSVSGNRVRIETASAFTDVVASNSLIPWQIEATPLPISMFQDLNRGTIQDRYVMRLRSARVREARFMVGMQFHTREAMQSTLIPVTRPGAAGFEETGQWAVLFRSEKVLLEHAGLKTDARVFATKGNDWLAIGATSVMRGPERLISSNAAINVAASRIEQGIRLDLTAATDALVEVRVPPDVSAVFVDDATSAAKPDHTLTLPLSRGEHHVRIHTGKSL
jgi:hypothetical protein